MAQDFLGDRPRSWVSGLVCNEPWPCPCTGSQYFLRKVFGVLWVGAEGLQSGVGIWSLHTRHRRSHGWHPALGGLEPERVRSSFLSSNIHTACVCLLSCRNKAPQTGLLETTGAYCHSPGGQKSKIKVSAGLAPSEPFSLNIDSRPPPMSSHGHPSGPICVLTASS